MIFLFSQCVKIKPTGIWKSCRPYEAIVFLSTWIKVICHPKLLHLRALIDTHECRVFLSMEIQVKLRELADKVARERRMSLAKLSRLLDTMVSTIDIVAWVRLHTRDLQWCLLPFQRRFLSCSLAKINIPLEV